MTARFPAGTVSNAPPFAIPASKLTMNCCWNGSIFSLDLESVLTAREQMSRKKSARNHLQSTDAIRDRFRVIRLSLKIRAIVLATVFREFENKGENKQISGEVFSIPFSSAISWPVCRPFYL